MGQSVDAILQTLTPILRDIFLDDSLELTAQLSARDVPGWDSFKHIEIIIAAEEAYGVKFSSREIDGLKNIGDLATLIAAKT